jgi:hypothetical protein
MGIVRGSPKSETVSRQRTLARVVDRNASTTPMKHVFEPTLFYSPRTASSAFNPPCGDAVIRRAINLGWLKTVTVGSRKYIKRDELVRCAEAGELK